MPSSPIASGSRPKPASTPGRQPIPIMTENWDEDFEFPTLALPKGKKTETPRKHDSHGPVDEWGEDGWDDSPPAVSRLPIANLGKRKSPTQPDMTRLSLSSPRASESVSSDLHLPRSPTSSGISGLDASSSALQLISGQPGPDTSNQRSRSGSITIRNKLIKRHPSTSFLPIGSSSSIDVSIPHGARSSYDLSRPPPAPPLPLPRSKSGEQMPPPPLPASRPRSKSKSKARPMSRQGEIRVSAIPLSPSSDKMNNVDSPRRPSFWKRLSGQPLMGEPITTPGSYIQDSVKLQHKRSASLGRKNVRDTEDRPPVPPIPANLRSPSATSTASNTSVSSSNRSGPSSISSIIRRTASGLSRKSQKDTPPPSSYPYATSNQSSSASVDSVPPIPPVPAGIPTRRPPNMPTSHSFSRGYHLPSPSAQSPYQPSLGSTIAPASMPHSASFPLAIPATSDSDTETEPEGQEQQHTPRRKKIRPVSALPAPRTGINRGWHADGWRGFSDQGPSGSKFTDVVGKRSASSEIPPSPASPRTGTFAMSTANTIRRIGSISKKHGRRLSGGFMFGGTPTSSNQGSPSTFLEPVVGSPSKPGRRMGEDGEVEANRTESTHSRAEEDESFDQAREMRDVSVSAPTSVFRAASTSGMTTSASEATILGPNKAEKERRRQSWNDFVIPKSIMEMQSGLNKNRSAIRHFDAGIRRLETLLDEREQALKNVEGDTSALEQLNHEYREEWAIASVLVRVGNTGRNETAGARVSSDSADHSSPRTRRITMASDEAAIAGDMLRSASDGTAPILSSSAFRSSTPAESFSSPLSPPRALTDKWRASTGRHDLTPRELELLRNIMNTPVSQRPSSSARQANTISSSSSLSGIQASESARTILASATIRQPSRSTSSDRSVSQVRIPSLSDSPFVIPAGSFPSPNTASALANPTTKRGGQKAGFAGFKDFLRSMSVKPSMPSSPSARKLGFLSSPQSPSFPLKSPLIPGNSPQPSIESAMQSPPGLTERQKKRTSVRNIFRSSSGDWSGLVNKDKVDSTPPLARQPSQADLARSKSKSRQSSPRRKISLKRAQREALTPLESPVPLPVNDRTVRPSQIQSRKSRIIGLGWPELEDGLPPSTSSTPPRPGPMRRSTTSDKEAIAATTATGHVKEGTAYSTWSDLPTASEGHDQKPRAASAQSDDLTVVLTPENLPRMLEYVQDCEKTLGRWRKRAEVYLKVGKET